MVFWIGIHLCFRLVRTIVFSRTLTHCKEEISSGSRTLAFPIYAEEYLWLQWLRGILVKGQASLTCEEDTGSCSDTTSQSSVNLDAASDSSSRGTSQSRMDAEDVSDSISSNSDADSQADESSGNEGDPESGATGELDARSPCDVNTDTESEASGETDIYGYIHMKRLFSFHPQCSRYNSNINWCSVQLNYTWEDIVRDYHDYTGKDFWDDVLTCLNAADPAFEARAGDNYDVEFFLYV